MIAFLSLSDLGGKMKTLFVTLLSFIALGFFMSIAVIIVRTTVSTPNILMEFIAKETFQVSTLLAGIGIFMGFWLLKTQLKTSAA
jgi:hypothetical protein